MLTGIFSTLLIPEVRTARLDSLAMGLTNAISQTKGKSLEELSGEDQDNFIQEAHPSKVI